MLEPNSPPQDAPTAQHQPIGPALQPSALLWKPLGERALRLRRKLCELRHRHRLQSMQSLGWSDRLSPGDYYIEQCRICQAVSITVYDYLAVAPDRLHRILRDHGWC